MERQREEAEQVARLRCQPTEGRKFMSLPFQRESRKPRVNLDRVASNSSSPPPLPQTKSSFSLKPQSPSPGSSPSSAMPHTSSAENVSGMGSSPLNFGEMPSQFETQKFSLQQPQSISRPNSVPSPLPPTSPSNSGGDSALPETDSSFSLQQEASSPRSPPHPAESSSPTPCSPSVTRQTHSPSPPPSPSSSPFSSPKPHRPSPRLVVPKKKTGQSPAPSRSVSPHPPSPNQLRSSSTPASQVLQETEGNTENKEENKVVENKVVEIKVENKGGEQGKEIEKKEGQEGQTLDLSTVTPIDIYTEIRQLFTDSYAGFLFFIFFFFFSLGSFSNRSSLFFKSIVSRSLSLLCFFLKTHINSLWSKETSSTCECGSNFEHGDTKSLANDLVDLNTISSFDCSWC